MIGVRRNSNATMYVQRYEVGQYKKLNNTGTTKVGEIAKTVQERRLTLYGHVMRRENHYAGRGAMRMKVQGRRNGRMHIREDFWTM